MPLSEKKKISNNRYLASMKTIALRMKPGEHCEMKESAAAAGQSLQGYILQAVRERMERDKAALGGADALAEGEKEAGE